MVWGVWVVVWELYSGREHLTTTCVVVVFCKYFRVIIFLIVLVFVLCLFLLMSVFVFVSF